MPNWCNNTIVVKGDADKIDALKKAVIDHKMLDHMMPMPKELRDSEKYPADGSERPDLVAKYGASCWYDWAVNNWQTKWDTGVEDETSISEEDLGDGRKQISFWFDSAWSPPIGAYDITWHTTMTLTSVQLITSLDVTSQVYLKTTMIMDIH